MVADAVAAYKDGSRAEPVEPGCEPAPEGRVRGVLSAGASAF